MPLSEFGIEIPSSPDRVKRILEILRSHEKIGPLEETWLIGDDGSELSKDDLLRAHTPEYVDALFSDKVEEILIKVFELIDENGNYHRYNPDRATRPLSGMFDRSLRGLTGTYQCCKRAMEGGFCFVFGGGGHHAHAGFGHGFCVLNDIIVALRKMQADHGVGNIWIIDVDAHKGDGVAAITQGDPSIITLSAHMAHGWPLDLPAPHPSYTPSDIDIPVDSGEEAEYVPRLKTALDRLAEYPKADLALVELGADAYERDGLESTQLLKLTLDQMNARNRLIYDFLTERDIPSAYLMSGGYGPHAWEPYPDFLIHALCDRLHLY